MPTRYFEVDPWIPGLGQLVLGAADRQRQYEEELHARTLARKAAQKKRAIIAGSIAAGAVGGVFLGPALGLGAAAAGAGASGGAAAGTSLGASLGIGLPGSTAAAALLPGVVTAGTGGGLSAGLLGGIAGAQIGANAGQAFANDNIALGVNAIAEPILDRARLLERRGWQQQDRAQAINDAIRLDRARTEHDLFRAEEAATIPTTGLTRTNAARAAREGYQTTVSRGPQAGQMIDLPSPYEPQSAYGPMGEAGVDSFPTQRPGPPPEPNIPGPSSVPGMERIWGPTQYSQLNRLEQERQNTVDNPEWIARNGPEAREAQWHALARQRQNIGTMLVPSRPQPMLPGPDGQAVPMQLGFNEAPPRPGILFDGQDFKPYTPTKADEQPFLQEGVEGSAIQQYVKDRVVTVNGNDYLLQPDGKLTAVRNSDNEAELRAKSFDAAIKALTVKDPNTEELVPPSDMEKIKALADARVEYATGKKASAAPGQPPPPPPPPGGEPPPQPQPVDAFVVEMAERLQRSGTKEDAVNFEMALRAQYPNANDVPPELKVVYRNAVQAGLITP